MLHVDCEDAPLLHRLATSPPVMLASTPNSTVGRYDQRVEGLRPPEIEIKDIAFHPITTFDRVVRGKIAQWRKLGLLLILAIRWQVSGTRDKIARPCTMVCLTGHKAQKSCAAARS